MSSIREIAIAKAVGGGGPSVTVEELTVTENGTYTAPTGKAYSPVTVNVPMPGFQLYDYMTTLKEPDAGTNVYSVNDTTARIITPKTYSDLNALNFDITVLANNSKIHGYAMLIGGRSQSGSTHYFNTTVGNADSRIASLTHGTDAKPSTMPGLPEYIDNHKFVIHFVNVPSRSVTQMSIDDNTPFEIPWTNTNVIKAPFAFFTGYNSADTASYINYGVNIYAVDVKDAGGNYVSRFVPCVRLSDNCVGFFDTISLDFVTTGTAKYATIGDNDCLYGVGNDA